MIVNSIIYELVKFGLVGIVNTIICICFIFLFMLWVKFNPYISNIIGYSIAVLNSYVMNKVWTFSSKKPHKATLPKFIWIFFLCYAFQLMFLHICIQQLAINNGLSQLLAMIIYTISSFVGHKLYSFKYHENS
jgi:putative flippase GtrA